MQKVKKDFDDLIIDYISGTISSEDEIQLTELLESDIELKSHFNDAIKMRAVSHIPVFEAQKGANYTKLTKQIRQNMPVISKSHVIFKFLSRAVATVAVVMSLTVATFYLFNTISETNNADLFYVTDVPIGSQSKIILPDSTIVWLNSGSSLKYDQTFGKKTREVFLTGEGYFEVQKNAKKPFYVKTGDIEVRVLGTIFNVRAYKEDNDIVINLISGAVDVSLHKNNYSIPFSLKPNEKITYNKTKKTFETKTVDASRSALWTTGKLCFVNATLEQISRDLERKYNVKISIESEQIKHEIFSGSLNLNLPLSENLAYIDVDKKFNINMKGDTIVIKIK
ncbi:MAG: FecR family protein [Paludibacter sp.]|nr:FecR family protein [Paludibacter sp.]